MLFQSPYGDGFFVTLFLGLFIVFFHFGFQSPYGDGFFVTGVAPSKQAKGT
jgi:hypothetical protein